MGWAIGGLLLLLALILIEESGQYVWRNRLYHKWVSQEETQQVDEEIIPMERPKIIHQVKTQKIEVDAIPMENLYGVGTEKVDVDAAPGEKPEFLYRVKQGFIRIFFYLLLVTVKVFKVDKAYRFFDKIMAGVKSVKKSSSH